MKPMALSMLLAALGCSSSPAASTVCPQALATHPAAAAWSAAPDDAKPIATTFTLAIDPTDPALSSPWRQPQAAPLTIGGGGAGLRLTGGVKSFANHAGRLYLELYLVNDGAVGLRDVTLQPSMPGHAAAFYDLSVDPLAAPTTGAPAAVVVGGIGPEGVSAAHSPRRRRRWHQERDHDDARARRHDLVPHLDDERAARAHARRQRAVDGGARRRSHRRGRHRHRYAQRHARRRRAPLVGRPHARRQARAHRLRHLQPARRRRSRHAQGDRRSSARPKASVASRATSSSPPTARTPSSAPTSATRSRCSSGAATPSPSRRRCPSAAGPSACRCRPTARRSTSPTFFRTGPSKTTAAGSASSTPRPPPRSAPPSCATTATSPKRRA